MKVISCWTIEVESILSLYRQLEENRKKNMDEPFIDWIKRAVEKATGVKGPLFVELIGGGGEPTRQSLIDQTVRAHREGAASVAPQRLGEPSI